MRSKRRRVTSRARSTWRPEPKAIIGLVLTVAALSGVGWLSLRAAVIRVLPANAPQVLAIAPHDGTTSLARLSDRLTSAPVAPPASFYGPLQAAAAAVPLDGQPFLITGIRALAEGRSADGVRLLEESRHRDPRERYTRLLLLDRYLRTHRVGEAVVEMTALNRLLPQAGQVLAGALAKLAIDPVTAGQARTALASDPVLLDQVLAAMATANVMPDVIERFAGPGAPRGLGADNWQPAMIRAAVARGDYRQAQTLWRGAYRLGPARPSDTLYDAAFRGLPGGAPFNWTTKADETGAAEIARNALLVEYYGRRGGTLASQLTVLTPGRYRLRFAFSGTGGGDDGGLAWTVACQASPDKAIVTASAAPLKPTPRVVAVDFAVPTDGCAAQEVALIGTAGEFAASISARISQLSVLRLP